MISFLVPIGPLEQRCGMELIKERELANKYWKVCHVKKRKEYNYVIVLFVFYLVL